MPLKTSNQSIIIIDLNTQIASSNSPIGYRWCYLTDYTLMQRYRFLGTDILGDCKTADIIASVSDAARTGDFRIYDKTNAEVIFEKTGVSSQSEENVETDITVSNLSTGPAMWEIQAKIDSVSGGHYVTCSQVIIK